MLIGKWRNFEELENDLTMPELSELLSAKIDYDDNQRRFFAAIQGVDLGEDPKKEQGVSSFEDIKARVFSGGQAKDANDILSLQGINAAQAGFGIGMGLEYTDAKDLTQIPSW
jgi:hypothetical protein